MSIGTILSWQNPKKVIQACVSVDIGSSSVRLRLHNAHNLDHFIDYPVQKSNSYPQTLNILENITQQITAFAPNFEAKAAVIAAAGAVDENSTQVLVNNWLGKKKTLSVEDLPRTLFPKSATYILNDIEAGAHGILSAEKNGYISSFFSPLWTNSPTGPVVSETRTALIAPRTGVGCAVICRHPDIRSDIVISSQFSHLQIPRVNSQHEDFALEKDLVQYLSDFRYDGNVSPEYEDLAGGRGIPLLYQYFYLKENKFKIPLDEIDAADIAQQAKNGDKLCRRALFYHYKFFFRLAQNITVGLKCDSILFGLNNIVQNNWFVQSVLDDMKKEFYDYCRPDWIANVRVFHQTDFTNFNLTGTTSVLKNVMGRQ